MSERAQWLQTTVDVPAGSPLSASGTPATEAAVEVLARDTDGVREGVVLQVPPGHTHAVNIAFGDRAATGRIVARTLTPGATFDTTAIRAGLQPHQRITAWSGPSLGLTLDGDGNRRPGHVLLNVIEVRLDSPS